MLASLTIMAEQPLAPPARKPQVPMAVKLRPFLQRQNRPGRPSLIDTAIAEEIIANLKAGSYWEPACEAAGVSYDVVRKWIREATEQREQGIEESEQIKFVEALARAAAVSEVAKVHKLDQHEDWRAQAFLMERGPIRERWGKPENAAAPQTVINLPESVGTALVEALRLAAAQPVIDITPALTPTDSAK